MAEESSIIPRSPFIPDQPPTVIQRQISEWKDRADLAQHAFDGQWRVLMTYEQFNLKMVERWVKADDDLLEMQHAVVPLTYTMRDDVAAPLAIEHPEFARHTAKYVAWIAGRRAIGEAITLSETLLEILCKAMH